MNVLAAVRAAAVLAAGSAVLAALAVLPSHQNSQRLDALLDAGHVPAYAFFAVVAWWAIRSVRWFSDRWTSILAFGVTALVGAGTELLQYFGPRNADLGDLGRDLAGASAGLMLVAAATGIPFAARWARGVLAALAFSIGVLALVPVGLVFRDYAARDAAFPMILDFEDPHEFRFLELRDAWLAAVPRPEPFAREPDRHAGLVTYLPSGLPALMLREVVPDWSAYDRFVFEAVVPDTSGLELLVRIDDQAHDGRYGDRFDARFGLDPGHNQVSIDLTDIERAPRSRAMDLRRMRSVTFFLDAPRARTRLYLDRVRLEPAAPTAEDQGPGSR